jgi:hypothetical protein
MLAMAVHNGYEHNDRHDGTGPALAPVLASIGMALVVLTLNVTKHPAPPSQPAP